MTSAGHAERSKADQGPAGDHSPLVAALRTTLRLVPLQLNDELSLAKAELKHKGSRLGSAAIFIGLALVLLCLLVIALVVAGIAGLAVIMPLWLSALIVSAFFLLVLAVCGLVGWRKIKKLMPLMPEAAWQGIRHDVGIAREGRDFDPATLVPEQLSKEERKARQAQKDADAAAAKADREAKAAENGPAPTEAELKQRTAARREHLLNLREELVEQASVKKQANYLVGQARETVKETLATVTQGAGGQVIETVKGRWVPLSILAVSATACIVFLRKLFRR